MINSFLKIKYYCYLKYLRYCINKINNINDIISIIKNIAFFNKDATSDKIITILIDCLSFYPLSETEMQKLSLLQQNYDLSNGIENYASFILWLSVIQSICEKNPEKWQNRIC